MKKMSLTTMLAATALLVHPATRLFGASKVLTFTNVAPGASVTFALPVAQTPIFLAVSSSVQNGGTQTPSEVMYAVINQDNKSSQITWVGTNNDGSVQVGTSIPTGSGPLIAKICGGSCPTENASLVVQSAASVPGTLSLVVNSETGTKPVTFVVTMLY
jgi:hypothetical protein